MLKGYSKSTSGLSSSQAFHSSRAGSRPSSNERDNPSSPPYAGRFVPRSASYSRDISPSRTPDHFLTRVDSKTSLVVNYLPSKFSSGVLAESSNAYQGGESRINSWGSLMHRTGDEADTTDFVDESSTYPWLHGTRQKSKKLRWNKFKWILFFANVLLTVYSFVALIFCLLVWFNTFQHADILRVGNRIELILSTLACSLGILTSVIGWAGILLNNRSFLAIYTFLLWIVFIFILIPGYMTYKRRTFNLEGKINAQWSEALGQAGRLRIQNELDCCGYFSPFVEATVSQTCYARTILPGCKLAYITFERAALKRWYTIVFLLVPAHLAIMIAGLLCSNHVTYRFGKGMMPKAYRLSLTSMAIIMEGYANQLAELYDSDVTAEIFGIRSQSNRFHDLASPLKHPQLSGASNSKLDHTSKI